jgi:predicted PurR-regulated permease PerM
VEPGATPRRGRWRGWFSGPDDAVGTRRAVRAAALTWLAVGALVLGYVAFRLAWPVLAVIGPPLLVAGLVVYALDPAVSGLARRGVPRWLGTLLTYVVVLTVLGGLTALAAPMVGGQVRTLVDEAPDLRARGKELLEQGLGAMGLDVSLRAVEGGEEIAEEVREEAEAALADEAARQRLIGALGGLAGAAASTARLLILLALGPIVAFYLLADLPRITESLRRLLPPHRRDELVALVVSVGRVTGGYVRGQMLVALFVGVASTLGFYAIGLPFWALVGLVAGVTNLVPFVGPFVGGFLGVAVAMLDGGVGLAVWVVVVVVIVQQLESQAVSPLVMGRTVNVHPLAVLLGVLVGGALYGLPGLLLAVPAVASAKVVAEYLWNRHIPWAQPKPPPDPDAIDGARVDTVVGSDA